MLNFGSLVKSTTDLVKQGIFYSIYLICFCNQMVMGSHQYLGQLPVNFVIMMI